MNVQIRLPKRSAGGYGVAGVTAVIELILLFIGIFDDGVSMGKIFAASLVLLAIALPLMYYFEENVDRSFL